jgi:large conductance mechanosensitive channel
MKIKTFLGEFKEFALRGNVIDLTVGVVIGTAFNNIVNSLVNNIIMPMLSIILGRVNISSLRFQINPLIKGWDVIIVPYGGFLQALLNFLIISFSIFVTIKLMSRLRRKEPEKEEAKLSASEELLTEIRDLLKEGRGKAD